VTIPQLLDEFRKGDKAVAEHRDEQNDIFYFERRR